MNGVDDAHQEQGGGGKSGNSSNTKVLPGCWERGIDRAKMEEGEHDPFDLASCRDSFREQIAACPDDSPQLFQPVLAGQATPSNFANPLHLFSPCLQ